MRESKGRAVVVGGSIAGVSAVHSLLSAGWEVVVLEKTTAPPTGSPTGAGLGLDPLSQSIIKSWLPHQQSDHLLNTHTLPLTIDQNQATDTEKKISRVLTRDESFNFRAAYWSDLHNLLYNALPPDIFYWGHVYQSFSVSDDKNTVKVQSEVVQTGNVVEFEGDLLVAADGCLSSIRQAFLPNLKLRYSGYCAWRGVLDLSSDEKSEILAGLQNVYQDLGKCLYFDLGSGTHSVFYELLNKKINWIWYVNQPEPQLKGNSVTMKVSNDMIKKMQEEAEKTWVPELVRVIKETKEPFLNVIYDCDPLQQIVWDCVVLIGEANVDVLDTDGDPPLVFALAAGSPECVRALLSRYDNIRSRLRDGFGPSVAHVCAYHGQPDCMRDCYWLVLIQMQLMMKVNLYCIEP